MKNVLRLFFLTGTLTLSIPNITTAADKPGTTNPEQRVRQLESRLEEIRAMDHYKLSREEKKALRAEVKEIKKEVKAIGGGVYISAGALILIILLIILLA